MRFRVLGPVEAEIDGAPVPIRLLDDLGHRDAAGVRTRLDTLLSP